MVYHKGEDCEPCNRNVNRNVDGEPISSIDFSGKNVKPASIKCAAQSLGIKVLGKDKSTGNPSGDGMHRPDDILVPIIFADRVKFLLVIFQIYRRMVESVLENSFMCHQLRY